MKIGPDVYPAFLYSIHHGEFFMHPNLSEVAAMAAGFFVFVFAVVPLLRFILFG